MCETTRALEPEATDAIELADLFRRFESELGPLRPEQAKAARAIVDCRSEALGGHLQECDRCGHRQNAYNSCRNRHCPKCQSADQARWLTARQADLLPVEYFHVVFTIPHELHPVFLANKKVCYGLLFAAVAETLKEVALNPKRLGARIGFTAVLHTWTQKLLYHPHLHCVVPGGGLSPDGSRWIPCKRGFFLPVKILATVFRGKLLSKLGDHLRRGDHRVAKSDPFALLRQAATKRWVVYSKAPFAGPEQVLRYLGHYTHRIAISNHRLLALEGRKVRFTYRDRADSNKRKCLTIDVADFLRRFLLHILPAGFMRIRHYGLLANACRDETLARSREHLGVTEPVAAHAEQPLLAADLILATTGVDPRACPRCSKGRLVRIGEIAPKAPRSTRLAVPA